MLFTCARFVIPFADAVAVLRHRINRFAADLGLDPARIVGMAVAFSDGSRLRAPINHS